MSLTFHRIWINQITGETKEEIFEAENYEEAENRSKPAKLIKLEREGKNIFIKGSLITEEEMGWKEHLGENVYKGE